MQFLKVPYAVFDYGLSLSDLKLYLYLVKCQNCFATTTIRIETIRRQCSIGSATTIRTAIGRLVKKGLITHQHRHGMGGRYISSKFTITQLKGKWFRLWLDGNPFSLDKSAFAVYTYLCSQRISYSGKACPSQATIAKALGIARHTVNDALKRLADLGAIVKAALWRGKHNLYTVMQSFFNIKKGTPLEPFVVETNEEDSRAYKSIFTVLQLFIFVKSLFSTWGCAIFGFQYSDKTLNPKKEKKKLQFAIKINTTCHHTGTSVPFFSLPANFLRWFGKIIRLRP